jgi:hypothetical protein
MAPARAPPLWALPSAPQPEIAPDPRVPEYPFDQRIAW